MTVAIGDMAEGGIDIITPGMPMCDIPAHCCFDLNVIGAPRWDASIRHMLNYMHIIRRGQMDVPFKPFVGSFFKYLDCCFILRGGK